MRLLLRTILLALVVLGGADSMARAGTIDFSDLPDGTFTTISGDRYQSLGVLFSTDGVELQVNRHLPDDNFIYGTSDASFGNADRPLIVDFVLPGTSTPGYTDSVSFFVINDSSPTASFLISIFGPGGVPLASIPGSVFTAVTFSRPEHDINRIVLTPIGSLNALGAPLVFGDIIPSPPSGVPEPSSVTLVGACLLGLAARRRHAA